MEGHLDWRPAHEQGDAVRRNLPILTEIKRLMLLGVPVQGDAADGGGRILFHSVADARALSHDINAECIKLGLKTNGAIWRQLITAFPSLIMTTQPLKKHRDAAVTQVKSHPLDDFLDYLEVDLDLSSVE